MVWATKLRGAIIEREHDPLIESILAAQCMRLRSVPIAIGCAPDHVHVLCRLDVTTPIVDLVRSMKSASSVLANRAQRSTGLQWQSGYAVFSVDPSAVRSVGLYIHNQRAHHANATLRSDLEPEFNRDLEPDGA
jgi:REP element-mobilizing transposase RayT